MTSVKIYHNPGCSKSRGALEILGTRGVDFEVVEYLEHSPSRADLERILSLLRGEPGELVRKDGRFRELGLDADDYTDPDAVVELLLAHPELMQRPVVIRGGRAVIARPPEKLEALLEDGA
jgi:arsenate reductase